MSAWWAGQGGGVNHSTLTITFYYLPGESVEQTWDLDLPVIFSEEIPPSRVAGRLREDNSALSVLRWDKWLMFTRQRQEYDKWDPSPSSSRQTESKNNYHERDWTSLLLWPAATLALTCWSRRRQWQMSTLKVSSPDKPRTCNLENNTPENCQNRLQMRGKGGGATTIFVGRAAFHIYILARFRRIWSS